MISIHKKSNVRKKKKSTGHQVLFSFEFVAIVFFISWSIVEVDRLY